MSEYLHRCGVHFGLGSGGFSLAICNQRGLVCAFSARSSMTSAAPWALVSVSVAVAILRGEGVTASALGSGGVQCSTVAHSQLCS